MSLTPAIPLTAIERQQLSAHRSLQMQQSGAPLFIDDVPAGLLVIVNNLRTLMMLADRQQGARAAGVADACSQASVMLLALADNISDGLAHLAELQQVHGGDL